MIGVYIVVKKNLCNINNVTYCVENTLHQEVTCGCRLSSLINSMTFWIVVCLSLKPESRSARSIDPAQLSSFILLLNSLQSQGVMVIFRCTILAMHFKEFTMSCGPLPRSKLAIRSDGFTDSALPYSWMSFLEQKRHGEWDIQMLVGFTISFVSTASKSLW